MNDYLAILPTPLPVADALAFVSSPAAGGIAVFLGATREQIGENGKSLLALHYEAYTDMAAKQLKTLAAEARGKWPILKLAILHRTGRVNLTEPSVLIAVSTPHRAEAFESCRWIMDTLKHSAAIWKQEIWSDGQATWVHPDKPD